MSDVSLANRFFGLNMPNEQAGAAHSSVASQLASTLSCCIDWEHPPPLRQFLALLDSAVLR